MIRTVRAALAAILLAGAAGACTSDRPAARPSPAATPAPQASASARETPTVTLKEAARAVRAILATDDVVRAAGDEPYALAQTRDAQLPIMVTEFRSTDLKPPRYTWGEPRLLVPRLDRFPLWFAALVERRDPHGDRRTALLAFMRQYENSRWQLSFSSLLNAATPLGSDGAPLGVALDGEGYATPLPTRDDTLAISPHLMAPLHATIAEEGPGGFAAGLIAAGPQTTGYFTEVGEAKPEAKRLGLLYDSIFGATEYPIYALRTTDGGAVVLYSLTRTTNWQAQTLNAAGLVPVPENARWSTGRPVVRRKLRVVETQQYVAHVQPRGATRLSEVVGYDGAVTGVSAD
ncbi:hypothetical protein GCM10009677_14330 [Sphaerisporangium rubeum]|uniref:DUF8094 domain-containing protein n=1 Tax=Sphaerisporangium rubeum TaxID=321317 RepID=A0A7X0IBM0_9ACTN|nr:hypothetical protein [Sphaerisporangium rubeum]MBB6472105.1 hypothetical protein [Sphaerisporangium rubeum]